MPCLNLHRFPKAQTWGQIAITRHEVQEQELLALMAPCYTFERTSSTKRRAVAIIVSASRPRMPRTMCCTPASA